MVQQERVIREEVASSLHIQMHNKQIQFTSAAEWLVLRGISLFANYKRKLQTMEQD